jgi:putative Holliday junction resolvase
MVSQMKYLGIDYGKKKIGIAFSDETGKYAFPETVLLNEKTTAGTPADKIMKICADNGITTVIVGESKDFKGKDNRIMGMVREFVELLRAKQLEVIYEPEVMSTIQAERIQGIKDDIDASAAAVILQSYLDRQKFKNEVQKPVVDKYTMIDDSIESERTMDDSDIDDPLDTKDE